MNGRLIVFGYPRLVRLAPLAVFFSAACGLALTLGETRADDDRPVLVAAAAVAVGVSVVLRTRVELGTDTITAVGRWKSHRFHRDEIAVVSWERGSSVVLGLRNGDQVSLPALRGHDNDVGGRHLRVAATAAHAMRAPSNQAFKLAGGEGSSNSSGAPSRASRVRGILSRRAQLIRVLGRPCPECETDGDEGG